MIFYLLAFTALCLVLQTKQRRKKPRAVRIVITVGGRKCYYKMQIRDDRVLTVSIAGEDAKGNPAPLASGAVPSWAVSDATFANISPSSDGLSATVTPIGPLGKFQVQVAIPEVGTEPAMNGSLDVEIVAGDATQIVLNGVSS